MPTAADGTRKRYVPGPEDQRLRLVERTVDLGEEGRYLVAVAGDALEIEDETQAFDRAHRGHLRRAGARAAAHHRCSRCASASRRSKRISEQPRGDPLRHRRAAGGQLPGRDRAARARDQRADRGQPRDRRARAHPCRQSRACAEDAALGDRQRGGGARRRSARRQGARAGRRHARPGARAISSARASRRARPWSAPSPRSRRWSTRSRARMEKIHRDRGIAIDIEAPRETRFRGERQDLEEMVGNLVDNACKWAQSRVAVEVLPERAEARSARRRLRIVVDDDGPGLTASERERVQVRAAAAARRDQARLRPRPLDRGRSRGALRRRADARHRADRRPARRTGAAGGVSAYPGTGALRIAPAVGRLTNPCFASAGRQGRTRARRPAHAGRRFVGAASRHAGWKPNDRRARRSWRLPPAPATRVRRRPATIAYSAAGVGQGRGGRRARQRPRREPRRARPPARLRGRDAGARAGRAGRAGRLARGRPDATARSSRARNYETRGVRCRDYTHTIYIDGRPQTARATACRNPDGTWTPVG